MSLEAMKMALRDLTMLCHHRTQETVEALRQAIEQEDKQEPFAYYMNDNEGYLHLSVFKTSDDWLPLYTAPPKREWVELTDDEIEDAWIEASDEYDDTISINNLGRILEAKLKEKNS
jgi:hypothetical protein